jgi:putative membrane protein
MIADHTRTGQEMMPAAEADSVSVPEKLEKKHQAKLEALKAADKSVFDNMYRAKQLKAHESAVALFSEYAKTAKRRIEDPRCQTLPTRRDIWLRFRKLRWRSSAAK